MKILHIINGLATGGAEKLLLDTIPIYQEKGIKADLLVLDGKEFPYLNELKKRNCCSVFSLGKGSLFNPLYVFKIIPYLRQYDVAHIHLFPAQYFVVFAKMLSFSKVRLVFTEHNTSNRRIQNKKWKYIERLVYSHYDKIVCITAAVKDVFLKYTQLEECKFQVIENGVNLKVIHDASAVAKDSLHPNLLPEHQLLIQVAGFRIQKDQKTVIRALLHLDIKVKLLFVGDGVLMQDCKELVKELGLDNRVFFLGIRTDVPSLLKTADVSIVSSHWEGFGLAAVEGMAAGKPVIASNVEGLADVVDGAGLLFEKENAEELAQLIKKLLQDEVFYNQIVQSGLERAQHYDINRMLNKHIEMYESLIN